MSKYMILIFLILSSIAFANNATSTVYVSIQYTSINIHVNMPGQWMIGDMQIETDVDHAPIDIQFTASGNLTWGTNSIPTYYQIYDGNNTSYVPNQPLNSNVWQTPSDLNAFSMTRGIGNHIFKIWFAMDVSRSVPKGIYTCWIQMSIATHP
ncbi:MAG: hypothetical protein ACP5G8_05170 [Athalassotoga sp.]